MILTSEQVDAICGERMPHPTLTGSEYDALYRRLRRLYKKANLAPGNTLVGQVTQLRSRVGRAFFGYVDAPAEQLRAEVDALEETINARMTAGV